MPADEVDFDNHDFEHELRERLRLAAIDPGHFFMSPTATYMPMAIELTSAVLPALSAVLGAWLQSRYGRKVRIKVGDIEVEASNPEEVMRLLGQAKVLRDEQIQQP